MRLSPGIEFLISQVGIPKEKTDTVSDLIPAPDETSGGNERSITHAGVTVKVYPWPRKQREGI